MTFEFFSGSYRKAPFPDVPIYKPGSAVPDVSYNNDKQEYSGLTSMGLNFPEDISNSKRP